MVTWLGKKVVDSFSSAGQSAVRKKTGETVNERGEKI